MTRPAVNQLTISGHVEREPQVQEHPDFGSVCTFVLTHTREHHESGDWELQFYNVAAYGPLGESFPATFHSGQRIVITGRLDCEHEQTLLGYRPLSSVIADSIIVIDGTADDSSPVDALPA
jgi:single-stranded DNA-binding protein